MAFCVLALRCYFKQQRFGVAGWTFLGAFTWSIVPYYGALLILFPYRGPNPRSSSPALAGGMGWPARALAALAAGLIAAFAAYVVWVEQFFGSPPAQISHRALPVSIACLALFLYLALKEFPHISLLPRWRDMTALDLLGRVGLLAALFGLLWVAHWLLQPFFSTRPIAPQHSLLLVRLICAYSVAKPLVFLLTQILYHGPAVILMVLFWRPMVRQAHRQGTALVLGLVLGLLLALCSEPRYWMVFFPIFVVLLAKVLDEQALGFGRLATIAGLGFFLSKAWLPLNWAPWPPDEPFHYEDVFRFPMQAFFMNYGTWMTTLTYAIQAVAVMIATLVLALTCTKTLPLGYSNSRHSSGRSGKKVM